MEWGHGAMCLTLEGVLRVSAREPARGADPAETPSAMAVEWVTGVRLRLPRRRLPRGLRPGGLDALVRVKAAGSKAHHRVARHHTVRQVALLTGHGVDPPRRRHA